MSRNKPGWIMVHSSLLDKGFTPDEFKIWVGLLLLAESAKSKQPGLVDVTLDELAARLHLSKTTIFRAKQKFLAEERIVEVAIATKTRPMKAIKILNFAKYQSGKVWKKISTPAELSSPEKISTPAELSNGKDNSSTVLKISTPAELSFQEISTVAEQISTVAEQISTPAELSRHEPDTANNTKNTKKIQVVPQGSKEALNELNENRKKVFELLKESRGYNSPNSGAEAAAITWMLKEGYLPEQIMKAHDMLKKEPFWSHKCLDMQSVKKQIGEITKGGFHVMPAKTISGNGSHGVGQLPTQEELGKSWG